MERIGRHDTLAQARHCCECLCPGWGGGMTRAALQGPSHKNGYILEEDASTGFKASALRGKVSGMSHLLYPIVQQPDVLKSVLHSGQTRVCLRQEVLRGFSNNHEC